MQVYEKTWDLPAHDAPIYRIVVGTINGRRVVDCANRADAQRVIRQNEHNPLVMWQYVESLINGIFPTWR